MWSFRVIYMFAGKGLQISWHSVKHGLEWIGRDSLRQYPQFHCNPCLHKKMIFAALRASVGSTGGYSLAHISHLCPHPCSLS